jgi:hypothetical protein
MMGVAIIAGFVRNIQFVQIGNGRQLALVARAELLVGPRDVYFDGIAMLPNRAEPSTLWLDRAYVHKTMREKQASEAHRIFSDAPPKVILWSKRMNDIEPVVGPLIQNAYVRIAPNIRIAGRRLDRGVPAKFVVPVAGAYALYDPNGEPLQAELEVEGSVLSPPFHLERGSKFVTLRTGSPTALLLPKGSYDGAVEPGPDDDQLFADVYK